MNKLGILILLICLALNHAFACKSGQGANPFMAFEIFGEVDETGTRTVDAGIIEQAVHSFMHLSEEKPVIIGIRLNEVAPNSARDTNTYQVLRELARASIRNTLHAQRFMFDDRGLEAKIFVTLSSNRELQKFYEIFHNWESHISETTLISTHERESLSEMIPSHVVHAAEASSVIRPQEVTVQFRLHEDLMDDIVRRAHIEGLIVTESMVLQTNPPIGSLSVVFNGRRSLSKFQNVFAPYRTNLIDVASAEGNFRSIQFFRFLRHWIQTRILGRR